MKTSLLLAAVTALVFAGCEQAPRPAGRRSEAGEDAKKSREKDRKLEAKGQVSGDAARSSESPAQDVASGDLADASAAEPLPAAVVDPDTKDDSTNSTGEDEQTSGICPSVDAPFAPIANSFDLSYDWLFDGAAHYCFLAYRQHQPFQQVGTTLSWVNAWWLAELSTLAYSQPNIVFHNDKRDYNYAEYMHHLGFTQFALLQGSWTESGGQEHETDVLLLEDASNNAFVIFRGSEAFKVTDWTTDFQVELAAVNTAYFKNAGTDVRVHKGFQEAFVQIVDGSKIKATTSYATAPASLKAWLSEHVQGKGKKLWISGHSLGASLATLFAYYALGHGIEFEAVYSYGTPRVGNPAFAGHYTQMLSSTNKAHYSFINNNDIVPMVPVRSTGYETVGTEVYIDSLGKIVVNDKPRRLADHREFSDSALKDLASKGGLLGELMDSFGSTEFLLDAAKHFVIALTEQDQLLKLTRFMTALMEGAQADLPYFTAEMEEQGYVSDTDVVLRLLSDGILDHLPHAYILGIWNDKLAEKAP